MDFQNFQISNFDGGKFLKIWSSINLPWDHVMSHKKFGPDRFSRFDVYWIQTNRQTDRQAKFIYRFRVCSFSQKQKRIITNHKCRMHNTNFINFLLFLSKCFVFYQEKLNLEHLVIPFAMLAVGFFLGFIGNILFTIFKWFFNQERSTIF